jgi:hypothetical protein
MTNQQKDQTYSPAVRWAGRLIAVLFGVLFAWLLLELFLRIAYPALPYVLQAPLREVHVTPFTEKKILPPAVVQPDSDYQNVTRNHVDNELQYLVPTVGIHITTKNIMDENSHVGFRVPDSSWEPRWPVDAVFVGDSHTFCFTEYEDCWVRRLDTQYGMSVVNLGQGATGSISHRNILMKFGLLYEPRFVVWQWYGNDMNEDYGMAVTYEGLPPVAEPNDAPAEEPRPPKGPVAEWLSANSAVYVIFDLLRSSEAERYRYNRFVDPYYFEDGELAMGYGRDSTMIGFDLSLEKTQIGLELGQEAIRDTKAVLDGKGIPLVMVLLPTKEEVYARWTEPTLGAEKLAMLAEGRQRMAAFCEEEGILCVDVTAELTAKANEGVQLFYPDDNHMNAAGNALLADVVWRFLVDAGLME